jgi:predicted NAD-dependent protein-ADP-ribosyltransferase YbiA (DUF1768 family)
MNETSSYCISNKVLFGSYPTQTIVQDLEEKGVVCFVNLTNPIEKNIYPYITNHAKIFNFPINDRSVPRDWEQFGKLIVKISNIYHGLRENESIYIHCRGGHGRSGVLVACLIAFIENISPEDSITKTMISHQKREKMREKWRIIGSPQTRGQKTFVYRYFAPFFVLKIYKGGDTEGMSVGSNHGVLVEEVGFFNTAEGAIHAHKDLEDKAFVKLLMKEKDPKKCWKIGIQKKVPDDWEEKKYQIIHNILKLKYIQNIQIKRNLMKTGLRPIIVLTRIDMNWENNSNDTNVVGKILLNVRNDFYEEE